MVGYVQESSSKWKQEGSWGFDSTPINFQPWKGTLQFFNVPNNALAVAAWDCHAQVLPNTQTSSPGLQPGGCCNRYHGAGGAHPQPAHHVAMSTSSSWPAWPMCWHSVPRLQSTWISKATRPSACMARWLRAADGPRGRQVARTFRLPHQRGSAGCIAALQAAASPRPAL